MSAIWGEHDRYESSTISRGSSHWTWRWCRRGGARRAGAMADLAVGVVDAGEGLVEGERIAVEVDADGVGDLGEQPHPCGPAGDALLRDDLLLGLRQQVGSEPAGRRQH